MRAWKSFDTLEDESRARSWLLTIVRRELARSFEKKRPELADVDALVAAESALLAAPEDERVAEMRAAIFRLEEEYREHHRAPRVTAGERNGMSRWRASGWPWRGDEWQTEGR